MEAFYLPARPATSLIASDLVQMASRTTMKLDPAKLTLVGSMRPEFAAPLPALSLRDRFSPVKLLPVSLSEHASHIAVLHHGLDMDLTCVRRLPSSPLRAFLCHLPPCLLKTASTSVMPLQRSEAETQCCSQTMPTHALYRHAGLQQSLSAQVRDDVPGQWPAAGRQPPPLSRRQRSLV